MIVVNTDFISGKNIETIALVFGSTVQSKNMFKDFGAGLKNLVGGELGSYTKMMDEARGIAIEHMIKKAEQMNADAVINLRFSTSAVMQGAAEVTAYGTAVKFV
ncbi:YbjQ family protein [Treponema sp. OMZ 792]|uniref:YbjQ family protein n=1 Tax=unclassified Treponema TaxID=2638727 RepID=UPI0020A3E0DC|nr:MULTISPECIES: YbjQ family protein [unclassified Treponema]UTC66374.1 YbjQ family protein [Treponema sp. OMZ 789]UTC69104.1 YbjQ family protein [Treponema sp. OMZ 790]UTC71816.1 YbjQ family protein [Treponema sp. OMZ 791]UTC74557.1 YbjQ family protein [Treponema sp. OMZ 792]UTC77167.1 YbjQ family protein [Treponema sp. OMZ 799]